MQFGVDREKMVWQMLEDFGRSRGIKYQGEEVEAAVDKAIPKDVIKGMEKNVNSRETNTVPNGQPQMSQTDVVGLPQLLPAWQPNPTTA